MNKSFFSPFNLLYSKNKISDIEKITFIATLFVGFFLFTTNFVFDSDGNLFIQYADALAYGREHLSSPVARYDISYPLLLWFSGYPYHHSLIAIAIINATMAILIPILIYLTIRPISSKIAYYVAITSIINFSAFYYIKWVRADHAYMFFSVLSMCLLSLFIDKKKPIYLYAMTFAVIAASFSRSAGNLMFPLFLSIAFLFARGSLKKYFICILIALFIFALYGYHRHQFFSKFGDAPGFNGGQTFQNLYVNSQEFAVNLAEERGPAMIKITDNLYKAMQPSPLLSKVFNPDDNKAHQAFFNHYVYPFTSKEFVKQIYQTPCIDYFELLYIATNNDTLFLKASWEIVKKHPLYPLRYTLRNLWHLLYQPGFAHIKYRVHRYESMGMQDAFPFYSESAELKDLSSRARAELKFDTLKNKLPAIGNMISIIKHFFCISYLRITKVIFYLIALAWIAAIIDLFKRRSSNSKLKIETFITIAISLYMLQSMLIISVFVDPLLRFHNHLMPFKIMLAGIGINIIINYLRQMHNKRNIYQEVELKNINVLDALSLKKYKISAIIIFLLIISLFISWSSYIFINTQL